MKAAVLHEIGQPLSVEDVPEPEAGEGQSVIEVKAAGINFADVLIRNGQYPQPPPLPVILGNEVAGDVDGRRVLAFVRGSGGGYAERAVVDEEWIFDLPDAAELRGRRLVPDDLPDRVDPVDAAGPHPSRLERARHRGGRRRRHGGDPGGEFCGAKVSAAAGSERKLELARWLGADPLVTYEEIGELDASTSPSTRWAARCSPLPRSRSGRSARDRDRVRRRPVGAGRPGAARRPQLGVLGLLPRPADGLGPDLVPREDEDARPVEPGASARRRRRFPLVQVNDALDLIESRKSTGKVVLFPRRHSSPARPAGSAARSSAAAGRGRRGAGARPLDGFDVSDPEAWNHVGRPTSSS